MLNDKEKKPVNSRGINDNLSHEQRKEMMNLMKRMLPPVPSLGIVDIRFSFWFFRHWYIVIIFGRDTRNQFKAIDKGDMDKSLTSIAKIFTYILMALILLIMFTFLLYMLKSYLGIDLYPDTHFPEMIKETFTGSK
ncbi:MAG: hypothetical protein PHO32_08655 [Candidatus Cloacimonetes bacterium]|nr:hypothetical protein [Candidatus Cloacimonadota bacterium]